MPSEYAERISHALAADDSDLAASRIKRTVGDELRRMDRRTKIVSTEFFNHSYSPDLVVTWPSNGVTAERPVFLRFRTEGRSFADEVRFVGHRKPIVFDLTSNGHEGQRDEQDSQDEEEAVSRTASENATLVTDADGLDQFISRQAEAPVVSLMSSALVQGGRGLVEARQAHSITESVERGFRGARALEASSALEATRDIAAYLEEVQADRMVGFLQAVWLGSGGRIDEFPGETALRGGLTEEGLEFLLRSSEITDDEFWRRIGRDLTVEQLSRLHVEGFSRNLQHLVSLNHDRLTAKICRVLEEDPTLQDENLPSMYWVVERGMVAIRGLQFTAYLAATQDQVTVEGPGGDGIELDVLLDRAERHSYDVATLVLVRGDRHVEYGSESETDVIHDPELQTLNDTLGPRTRVRRATVTMSTGSELEFDFGSLTASGRTTSKFPLKQLLRVSLALFLDVGEGELSTLLPAPRNAGDDQPTLFA